MSVAQPDKKRRLLPRWQPSGRSIVAGELASLHVGERRIEDTYFEERKREWEREQSPEIAAELIGSAIVLGRVDEVERVAQLVADEVLETTTTVRQMAQQALHPNAGEPEVDVVVHRAGRLERPRIYADISNLRGHLNAHLRSPLEWVDLGRLYAILGQREKAEHAIRLALILAPQDRFVLRCAARFYVHIEQEDRALALLQRAPATRLDPWLMASEISVALIAGRPSKIATVARKGLERDNWTPRNRSELEGALGTLLLEDGATVKARQRFLGSLDDPTENALAQAQWATDQITGLIVPEKYFDLPATYEANALRYRATGKWDSVIDRCWYWADYEPTSSRPMVMGSYAAAIAFEDGPTIVEFSERGLETDPRDPILRNNRIVGLAYSGNLDEAWQALADIIVEQEPEVAQPALYATTGLICFRSDELVKGRDYYNRAIMHPYSRREPRIKALALWHLALEEARAGTQESAQALERAEKATEGMKFPEIATIRARLPKQGKSRQR